MLAGRLPARPRTVFRLRRVWARPLAGKGARSPSGIRYKRSVSFNHSIIGEFVSSYPLFSRLLGVAKLRPRAFREPAFGNRAELATSLNLLRRNSVGGYTHLCQVGLIFQINHGLSISMMIYLISNRRSAAARWPNAPTDGRMLRHGGSCVERHAARMAADTSKNSPNGQITLQSHVI